MLKTTFNHSLLELQYKSCKSSPVGHNSSVILSVRQPASQSIQVVFICSMNGVHTSLSSSPIPASEFGSVSYLMQSYGTTLSKDYSGARYYLFITSLSLSVYLSFWLSRWNIFWLNLIRWGHRRGTKCCRKEETLRVEMSMGRVISKLLLH